MADADELSRKLVAAGISDSDADATTCTSNLFQVMRVKTAQPLRREGPWRPSTVASSSRRRSPPCCYSSSDARRSTMPPPSAPPTSSRRCQRCNEGEICGTASRIATQSKGDWRAKA